MRLAWGLIKLGVLVGAGVWVGWRYFGNGNLDTQHIQDRIEAAAARSEWIQHSQRVVREARDAVDSITKK